MLFLKLKPSGNLSFLEFMLQILIGMIQRVGAYLFVLYLFNIKWHKLGVWNCLLRHLNMSQN